MDQILHSNALNFQKHNFVTDKKKWSRLSIWELFPLMMSSSLAGTVTFMKLLVKGIVTFLSKVVLSS